MKKKKNYKQEQGNYTLSTKANSKPLFGTSAALHISALGPSRQLSGLVVRMPACCAEGGGSNPGWGTQDFQYRLSSAETQQPVDRMRRKARGCLVLSVLC